MEMEKELDSRVIEEDLVNLIKGQKSLTLSNLKGVRDKAEDKPSKVDNLCFPTSRDLVSRTDPIQLAEDKEKWDKDLHS